MVALAVFILFFYFVYALGEIEPLDSPKDKRKAYAISATCVVIILVLVCAFPP